MFTEERQDDENHDAITAKSHNMNKALVLTPYCEETSSESF